MKRTQVPMWEREKLIDEYCIKTWALSNNAVRDYRKTVLLQIQKEIEMMVDKQTPELRPLAPAIANQLK